jgi:hypothetical protein
MLVLTSDVVELGSGVQISHLARGGIEVTERLAHPDLPTPQSCQQPNLKFEHPTPKAPTLYFECLNSLHQLALNHYRKTRQKLYDV